MYRLKRCFFEKCQRWELFEAYYNSLIANQNIGNGKGIPAPFIDNHDMPRYTYQTNLEKNKFTFGLLGMMNGTIFSYYGDEVGLYGTNKGNNNVDQNVRTPIKWGDFTNLDCSVIEGVTNMVYPYPTVKEQLKYIEMRFGIKVKF